MKLTELYAKLTMKLAEGGDMDVVVYDGVNGGEYSPVEAIMNSKDKLILVYYPPA